MSPVGHVCGGCGRITYHPKHGRCEECVAGYRRHVNSRKAAQTPAEEKAFYASAAWRRCRKAVLARDEYTCQACGGMEPPPDDHLLSAHHVKPRRTHPELALDPTNCVTMHATCHGRLEGGRRR